VLLKVLLLLALLHSLIVAGIVIWEKRNPTSALAWLLAITFLPFLGVWLYLLFGRRRFRQRAKSMTLADRKVREALPRPPDPLDADERWSSLRGRIHPAQRGLMMLARNIGEFAVTEKNRTKVLRDASLAYPAMEEAILGARQYVHVEYYIFEPDATGRRFLELLAEKARAGLEVRLLVDHFGSGGLTRDFLAPFLEAGGRFSFCMETRFPHLLTLWRLNYRNHRKIIVVDGATGFTGGMNIGDNYLGRDHRVGYWRDMHLQLDGPAVGDLQRIFAEDWLHATGEILADPRYAPLAAARGDDLVQIIPSGPDMRWDPIHKLLFEAIVTAGQRVYITSPYFIPDATILQALTTSALRGVDVRLLLPGKSDLPLVRLAGRSYFEELLQAGVRIFEYQAGVLHAKTLVADGRYGSIGSANMDIRSFHLNFEVNAFVYSEALAGELEEIFLDDLRQAREITLAEEEELPLHLKLPERLARLLSGLM
jgi:cardiolipin synthase